MRMKIITIFISMLFLVSIFSMTTIAGDEENPEIKDFIDDTDLKFLDIESAWFFEEEENPEYLYISLKINYLKENYNAVFSVRWTYNNDVYISGLDTFYFKNNVFRSGLRQRATHWQWKNMPECFGLFNIDTDIITWKILKSNIGNPQKGDILSNTEASAVPGFPMSFLYFFLGNDYRDFAPDTFGEYGLDYIIKY
jgi:hypothetical protein